MLAPQLADRNADDAVYPHDELAAAQTRHFWFEARNRLIIAALCRHFPNARSFLDLGCGTGGVLAALDRECAGLTLVAADALLGGLAFAMRRVPTASFIQVDVRSLPYEREFDVIGVFDVLEHLDDDELVLRHMYRATLPGGGVVITVPQHPWLWSAIDEFSRHRRRYTKHDLADKVSRAGFDIVQTTSFMTLVLPALMLSRMAKKDLTALDPVAELHISALANRVFRAICRIEERMIAFGWSLPVGGSLLMIARRPS